VSELLALISASTQEQSIDRAVDWHVLMTKGRGSKGIGGLSFTAFMVILFSISALFLDELNTIDD
jgi:hypothetical protein